MPDAIFDDPRLAAIYDALDPDRSDLEAYLRIVDALDARSVLDVGCGTGTFACLLAASRDVEVIIGVDPAAASLQVARSKPGADRVRWVDGDATTAARVIEHGSIDMAMMTANVAQVFVDDSDWSATLAAIATMLRRGGHLVFETRVPERRAWDGWTKQHTFRRTDVAGVGIVEDWVQVTDVSWPLVRFESPNHFVERGETIVSTSTLRFRGRDEVTESLDAAGFDVVEVRDAPDRPGLEFVFIARRRAVLEPI